jgi:hypothetical protein
VVLLGDLIRVGGAKLTAEAAAPPGTGKDESARTR